MKQVCHRDLKLENTLLDGSPAPRLKICDFGYSKVVLCYFDEFMKQIETPHVIAHEVLFVIFSHRCFIHNQSLLWELLLILLLKFC